MSQRREIWTIAQKWMTMNENVKKEEENEKDKRKTKKTKKTKTKIKRTSQRTRHLKFGPQLRIGWE